jgi:membrane-associated phospholipid phosphatase
MQFFPVWRESITWVPLYLFLVLFIFINFKSKGWIWFLLSLLLPSLTDILSSHFIKEIIERPRPCKNVDLNETVRLLLNRCPDSFSFTSSHATNHFGIAVFIFLSLKQFLGNYKWIFIFWAASISYGQVYVGVHYPLDILGGALVGILSGWIAHFIFNKVNQHYPSSKLIV